MDAFQLVAMVGLLSLGIGLFVVNKVTTPHAGALGLVVAAFGIAMLVIVAIRQLVV